VFVAVQTLLESNLNEVMVVSENRGSKRRRVGELFFIGYTLRHQ
jgi:hypothetical protein